MLVWGYFFLVPRAIWRSYLLWVSVQQSRLRTGWSSKWIYHLLSVSSREIFSGNQYFTVFFFLKNSKAESLILPVKQCSSSQSGKKKNRKRTLYPNRERSDWTKSLNSSFTAGIRIDSGVPSEVNLNSKEQSQSR